MPRMHSLIFQSCMVSPKQGIVQYDMDTPSDSIEPLFKTILKHCEAYPDLDEEPLQMQISALGYDEYIGRLGIGRIYQGVLKGTAECCYL